MSIDLFRSEPMVHVSICFVDSAREATLNEIGAFNGFHPIDVRFSPLLLTSGHRLLLVKVGLLTQPCCNKDSFVHILSLCMMNPSYPSLVYLFSFAVSDWDRT